jgi:hypothetical protein
MIEETTASSRLVWTLFRKSAAGPALQKKNEIDKAPPQRQRDERDDRCPYPIPGVRFRKIIRVSLVTFSEGCNTPGNVALTL